MLLKQTQKFRQEMRNASTCKPIPHHVTGGISLVQNADIHRHTCQPFFWSTSIFTPNPPLSSGEQLNSINQFVLILPHL